MRVRLDVLRAGRVNRNQTADVYVRFGQDPLHRADRQPVQHRVFVAAYDPIPAVRAPAPTHHLNTSQPVGRAHGRLDDRLDLHPADGTRGTADATRRRSRPRNVS